MVEVVPPVDSVAVEVVEVVSATEAVAVAVSVTEVAVVVVAVVLLEAGVLPVVHEVSSR